MNWGVILSSESDITHLGGSSGHWSGCVTTSRLSFLKWDDLGFAEIQEVDSNPQEGTWRLQNGWMSSSHLPLSVF
jgi:hypothetical protein